MIVLSQDKMTVGDYCGFSANTLDHYNGDLDQYILPIVGYIRTGGTIILGEYTVERAKEIILELCDLLKHNVLSYEMPEN